MSGKFTVRIDLKDEEEGGDVSVFANGGHLAIQAGGEGHTILDDRTVIGTLASQDADFVTITGGSITGITPIAVADGGTGASTAAGALSNLGALPDTTPYGASLAADGRDISLIGQNGDTLATVQTQDISGKLDKQATYSADGVVSRFFHEPDGGGYQLTDSNDNSVAFLGGNADASSPIKVETYAKTVADNVGTRIIQTLEKVYYTAGKNSSAYATGDEVAVKANIPTALSQLTNDGNYVVDSSYVHTDSNFTAEEKSKLAGLDDNHFKGSYPSLDALETAHPTASDGDYAYVGVEGVPAIMYLWDVTDEEWVPGGSPAGETPASVKEKYESNPDTNAFTDSDVTLIGTIGDVDDLETTAKDTLVDAVNEVVGTFDGYVPTTRTVNGHSLDSNIVITNSDIGSEPAITAGTPSQFWRGDKSWSDFGDSVRATLLTGLSTGTKTAIAATDTVIVALGKLQAQVSASGFPNPMTAAGDIIVGGQNGTPTRLPVGSVGQVISSNGTSLLWADNSQYSLPIATTTTLGGIMPDGTTIIVNPSTGVASAVGGGGGSSGWVPSGQYIDITYGVAGDAYTAPADGWMYVECMTFNTNAYIVTQVIINEGSPAIYGAGSTTYSASRNLYLLFPVGAGYSFRMYNSNLNVNVFRFVYSKGALGS